MPIIERALDKLQAERKASRKRAPAASEARNNESRVANKVDIDVAQLQDAGLVPRPEDASVDIRKHFQAIKRPLLTNALDPGLGIDRANMVVVTSPLPDAGKTFISVNLAMSLGLERDKGAILVDGDVAHRQLSRSLGLGEAPGLMDLIVDHTLEIRDVILETRVQGVRILPAGLPQADATELLASRRMGEICTRLASEFSQEIVVWDSPPMLITNEAAVLAAQVGQVLVVVEAGVTSRAAVHDTLQLIDRVKGDRAVNMVLNKTTQSVVESQYGDYGADGYQGARAV